MTADFDWRADESVVVPEQQAIACYFNDAGSIVIRQQRDTYVDSDHVVIVEPSNLASLILALQSLQDEASA